MLALLLAAASFMPVLARAETQTYDIYFTGLKAAELSFQVELSDRDYAAEGGVRDAGILGRLVTFRFSGQVSGKLNSAGLVPVNYSAVNVSRNRERRITMSFRNRVPVSVEIDPARARRPFDVDPATQQDVLDPLSAALTLLTTRLESAGCAASIDIFDGARRSQILVGEGGPTEEGRSCKGVYRRVAGFSPQDMEARTDFPFTLYLRTNGQGNLEVSGFITATTFGDVTATRR